MRLHGVSFKNFKSFKDEVEITLKDINYFIGPNGSGKSNILNGVKMLEQMSISGGFLAPDGYFDDKRDTDMTCSFTVELSREEVGKMLDVLQNRKSPDRRAEPGSFFRLIKHSTTFRNGELHGMELSATDRRGSFRKCASMRFSGADNYISTLWKIDWDDQGFPDNDPATEEKDWVKSFVYKNPGGIDVTQNVSHMAQKLYKACDIDMLIPAMTDFFSNMKKIPANRQSPRSLPARATSEIEPGGSNLSNEINAMDRQTRFSAEDLLKMISSGDIRQIDIVMEEGNNVIKIQEDGLENPTDHARFSSGYHQMVILNSILPRIRGGTVTIEEPEIHLHARRKKSC